ncbi:glycine betaine/proline transport system substrate-binding protein [Alkalibacillus filiformis]|uniref:Glycine betaine/proline transport system substrate-binding protein n=1 Tax=Alkalibacillus filiformis TaxID=200990 RepID=A0ABU0DTQ9_9BACI|nr:glycine betaine ABC transporter substrate-binding protein [Alkalibacillus filiformis]MDQ0351673.1 glycine betaine/proline transport system substrate-binding protein [Alkalibacillus filiformis]
MLQETWKRLGLIAVLALTLVIAACGTDDEDATEDPEGADGEETTEEETLVGEGKEVELVYVEWDSEIASTHVVGHVLEDLGYDVDLTPIDNAVMWQSVANGQADGMVAAWLPGTHGDLYEEYQDDLVDLGENLSGAKIGLVVPEYMEIDSIEDLDQYADELGETITGIEAGAGVVQAAENATETYANLEGWDVQTSSSGAMATALGEAISNEEAIVVTGWTPHWKFAEYDLKYLEDPELSFGEEEFIGTMVREGLEEDLPNAYKVLDQFNWGTTDMEEIMLAVQEGTDVEEAVANWIEENEDKVSEWTEGLQ